MTPLKKHIHNHQITDYAISESTIPGFLVLLALGAIGYLGMYLLSLTA